MLKQIIPQEPNRLPGNIGDAPLGALALDRLPRDAEQIRGLVFE